MNGDKDQDEEIFFLKKKRRNINSSFKTTQTKTEPN